MSIIFALFTKKDYICINKSSILHLLNIYIQDATANRIIKSFDAECGFGTS